MTIDEIYTKIISHMKKGVNMHEQMAHAYDFLGLEGLALCHAHHAAEEHNSCMLLQHQYSCRFHKLIKTELEEYPAVVPQAWYKYTTSAVDTGTKREALKELMNKWITWEQETVALLSEMHKALVEEKQIAASLDLNNYILDVDKELRHAEKKLNKLETFNYDAVTIIEWQKSLYEKYKKKMGW